MRKMENQAVDLLMEMYYFWDELETLAKKTRRDKENAPFVIFYNSETGTDEKLTIYKFRNKLNSGKVDLWSRAVLYY